MLTDADIEQLGFEAARNGEEIDSWSLTDDEKVPFERGWRRGKLRLVTE